MTKHFFHRVYNRNLLFSLFMVLFCGFTSGCMSYVRGVMYDIPRVIGESMEKPMFYCATQGDASLFWEMGVHGKSSNNPAAEPCADLWIRLPFFTICSLIDLPFSIVYDTLLLPFDCGYCIHYRNNDKKDIE